jgi:hypothetical protein
MPRSISTKDFDSFRRRIPALAAVYSHRIVDPQVVRAVDGRARAFRTETVGLSLEIELDLMFDLGARHPGGSSVAGVLKEDNEALRNYVARQLGIKKLDAKELSSVFVIYRNYDPTLSKVYRTPVFLYSECVVVILKRKEKDHGIFLIGEKGFRKVVYTSIPIDKIKLKDSRGNVALDQNSRFYGLHSHFPIEYRGQWRAARYKTKVLLPKPPEDIDALFQGIRLEVAELTAISKKPVESAKFIGLALPQARPSRLRPKIREAVQTDDGSISADDDAGYNYCINLCAAGAFAAAAGVLKLGFPACATLFATGLGLFLCGAGLGLAGAAAIYDGYGCSQLCKQHFKNNVSDGDNVDDNNDDGDSDGDADESDGIGDSDGSNDGDSSDEDSGDSGDGGTGVADRDGGLPFEEPVSPFFD